MAGRPTDALELLEADHRHIEQLFDRYLALSSSEARSTRGCRLAGEICMAITIHSRLVQELLHPAAREAMDDDETIDDNDDLHEQCRELAGRVLASRNPDPLRDAKVAALRESAARLARHERDVVFARLRRTRFDASGLGRSIALRKEELKAVADALREDVLAASLTG